ncbi:hypothetical protein HMPREF1863_01402 [Aedoeadaptatus coxii]|uniref:Uncharacterized protein n=1 Tax=Aedoeadaptatus coxii TaxID=755172 RepID=A0A134AC75_9FIRM|nr:hypothetical protein [Peptoniphilus coxii]KXB65306.1 hypothetical protein HMPREF1863_01402 [Peptoniphilus coxii]
MKKISNDHDLLKGLTGSERRISLSPCKPFMKEERTLVADV